MDKLIEILPFIIPLLILQLGLAIYCLLDLRKRERTRGPKWVWLIVILLGELLGPIVYLVWGRQE